MSHQIMIVCFLQLYVLLSVIMEEFALGMEHASVKVAGKDNIVKKVNCFCFLFF